MADQNIPIEGVSLNGVGRLVLQDMRAKHLLKILLNFRSANFSDKPEEDFAESRTNGG